MPSPRVSISAARSRAIGRLVPYVEVSGGAVGTNLRVREIDSFLLLGGIGAPYFATERTRDPPRISLRARLERADPPAEPRHRFERRRRCRVAATFLGAAADRALRVEIRRGGLTREQRAPGFEAFAGTAPAPPRPPGGAKAGRRRRHPGRRSARARPAGSAGARRRRGTRSSGCGAGSTRPNSGPRGNPRRPTKGRRGEDHGRGRRVISDDGPRPLAAPRRSPANRRRGGDRRPMPGARAGGGRRAR